MHAAACDPGSWPRRRQSSELSRSQNKLIQCVKGEVRAVIISGLWRGCCHTACTGGCPSCCLSPTRMQADRQQVYLPGVGRGARVLIFCPFGRAGDTTHCMPLTWQERLRKQDMLDVVAEGLRWPGPWSAVARGLGLCPVFMLCSFSLMQTTLAL